MLGKHTTCLWVSNSRDSADSWGRKWRGVILGSHFCVCVCMWAKTHYRVAMQQQRVTAVCHSLKKQPQVKRRWIFFLAL